MLLHDKRYHVTILKRSTINTWESKNHSKLRIGITMQ